MLVDLFNVPLLREDFFLENQKEIIEKFYQIENTNPMPYGKYPLDAYTSFHTNTCILDLPELEVLKNFIFEKVSSLHIGIGLSGSLRFTSSWFTINRKYSYHESHNHCPNIWSGIYYINANENDATVNFINKNLIDTGWPYNANKLVLNDYLSSERVCKVSSGMLLIFPSYLLHKVEQQQIDSERINIAFNLDLTNVHSTI